MAKICSRCKKDLSEFSDPTLKIFGLRVCEQCYAKEPAGGRSKVASPQVASPQVASPQVATKICSKCKTELPQSASREYTMSGLRVCFACYQAAPDGVAVNEKILSKNYSDPENSKYPMLETLAAVYVFSAALTALIGIIAFMAKMAQREEGGLELLFYCIAAALTCFAIANAINLMIDLEKNSRKKLPN